MLPEKSSSRLLTSAHNEKIRHLQLLQQKSSARRDSGTFVVEGIRELKHCLHAKYKLQTLFLCTPLLQKSEEGVKLIKDIVDVQCYEVPQQLYEKVAYREKTEGIIAIVEARMTALEQLSLSDNPLLVIIERVEKPGNIGAILRSADAAKADAVIICDPLTDLYNPNIVRSSIGAVFTVPSLTCSSEECIRFLKARGIQILTAQLQDSEPYYATDMRTPTAIVMGTEDKGLSQQWRKAADKHIRIPMQGQLDSLNVSVSTAILLFEAVRQRQG